MGWARLAMGLFVVLAACSQFGTADPPPDSPDAGADAATGPFGDGGSSAPEAGASISPCSARKDLLFCDGFDDPTLSGWASKTYGNGTAKVDAHEGHASVLRADVAAGNGISSGFILHTATWPGPTLYVRVLMYFDDLLPAKDTYALIEFLDVELDIVDNHLLARQYTEPTFDATVPSVIPTKQWICLEWKLDEAEMTLKQDGALVATHTGVIKVPTKDIELGVFRGAPQGVAGAHVFFDDLAVGTQPIGCN
jgi:hypothetical protein